MGLLLADTCVADTLVLLATIVGLLYYYSISTFKYWAKQGIKTVGGTTPLFGGMGPAMSLSRQFGLHIQDLYKEAEEEKFVGFYKMRDPSVLLRDPALVKLIMLKDFSSFMDNDIKVNEKSDPMLAYNIFSMKGDKWKYARSKFSPIFSTGKIRNMFPLILEVCKELKDHVNRNIDSGNPEFDAKNLAATYTTDVVATCAFGIKCNSLLDENNDFRKLGKDIMTPSKFRGMLMMIAFFWPSVSHLCGLLDIKFFSEEVNSFFRNLVSNAMEFREKNNVKRNDLIQLLMQLKKGGEVELDAEEKQAKNGENNGIHASAEKLLEFTDDVLAAQAVGFFFDGFETSSIALSMAMHELAVNPDIQSKLRDEINKSIETIGGGELTYDVIRECAYLDMVFLETLRKYPPAGVLTKSCTKPYQMPDSDVRLKVGTAVVIPVYALHHDPQYFPDPETFDPERFNEGNKKNIVPGSLLSFGDGPRQCVGMRFALAQVKAALATIVTNFELQRSPKTQHPITLDPNFFLISVLGGTHIQAVPL